MKKLLLLMIALTSTITLFAQSTEIEMATAMRSSGKIYVVVAVIAVIFIGLVFYLISIDRKLKKLETKD